MLNVVSSLRCLHSTVLPFLLWNDSGTNLAKQKQARTTRENCPIVRNIKNFIEEQTSGEGTLVVTGDWLGMMLLSNDLKLTGVTGFWRVGCRNFSWLTFYNQLRIDQTVSLGRYSHSDLLCEQSQKHIKITHTRIRFSPHTYFVFSLPLSSILRFRDSRFTKFLLESLYWVSSLYFQPLSYLPPKSECKKFWLKYLVLNVLPSASRTILL